MKSFQRKRNFKVFKNNWSMSTQLLKHSAASATQRTFNAVFFQVVINININISWQLLIVHLKLRIAFHRDISMLQNWFACEHITSIFWSYHVLIQRFSVEQFTPRPDYNSNVRICLGNIAINLKEHQRHAAYFGLYFQLTLATFQNSLFDFSNFRVFWTSFLVVQETQ